MIIEDDDGRTISIRNGGRRVLIDRIPEEEMNEGYDDEPEHEDDEDRFWRSEFADPGGKSALRA
jgi:hypothetical protein